MSKYQFIINSGPDNPTKATRAMMFASRCIEEGHEVSIFLVDDAVYLANLDLADKLQAATGDTMMQYLKVILAHNTPVNVCMPCAKVRKIHADDLPQGWRIEKGVEAIRLSEQGYTTWIF